MPNNLVSKTIIGKQIIVFSKKIANNPRNLIGILDDKIKVPTSVI